FTLVRDYPGRLRLLHVDIYRLDHLQEVVDLGVGELIDEGGVALVEWGDLARPVLAADYLEIRIRFGEADDERRLTVNLVGPSWSARQRALLEAVERWLTEREARP
ncbi:MAG: tRNA (adenosine(37)-N6)-threonylcarbamoyltransferase complex ATPase subunit type 1 TsaE, partial [Acidimicrobiales bacterium]